MTVSIRDVASRLHLSITTVSRALDGYSDVAEGTRVLVERTASEMGYVPNRAARQLRRMRTDTLGYILPASPPNFTDPFFAEFIAGLGDGATQGNFDLLVSSAPAETQAEKDLYQRWVRGRKVDGIVLNRVRLQDWRVRYLSEHGVPFVSLERSLDVVDFVGVEVDSWSGIQLLLSHLVSLGQRRIGYIGAGKQYKIHADRFAAYRQGLGMHGLLFDPRLVAEGDLTSRGGYSAAGELLDQVEPPTSITCINDLTAIGVLHAAHERGLVVGRDLAVTGFDGVADSAYSHPPLTTLTQPVFDIARQLACMLLALINGDPLEQRQVLIQPELIVRQSTTG